MVGAPMMNTEPTDTVMETVDGLDRLRSAGELTGLLTVG